MKVRYIKSPVFGKLQTVSTNCNRTSRQQTITKMDNGNDLCCFTCYHLLFKYNCAIPPPMKHSSHYHKILPLQPSPNNY